MKKRETCTSNITPRMLDIQELMKYTSLGKNSAYDLGVKAGAKKMFGRRALFDRIKIDQYLDELEVKQA